MLSTETGHARNYGRDPYGAYNPPRGYYASSNLLFPAHNDADRYDRKTIVMGARVPEGAVAFLKDAIREQQLLTGEIGDLPVLAVHDTRYDTAYVYRNPDEAEFGVDGDGVVAADGTSYGPADLPLSRIHTFDAMWSAWAGFYPETVVYE